MIHGGNVIGFGIGESDMEHMTWELTRNERSIGFLDLGSWPFLQFIGGSQFRKICILSLIVLVLSVLWTCWYVVSWQNYDCTSRLGLQGTSGTRWREKFQE